MDKDLLKRKCFADLINFINYVADRSNTKANAWSAKREPAGDQRNVMGIQRGQVRKQENQTKIQRDERWKLRDATVDNKLRIRSQVSKVLAQTRKSLRRKERCSCIWSEPSTI